MGKEAAALTQSPIEMLSLGELEQQWQAELKRLGETPTKNPSWEWPPVQEHLERLHALAQELRRKRALERARWQP